MVVGTASADVPRYQPSATLVVSLLDAQPGNQHTYTINWTHPCSADGAFIGTGQSNAAAGGADRDDLREPRGRPPDVHGDYVSQVGGGADAAHYCIGMPIQSNG
jgi:hypothetical protein